MTDRKFAPVGVVVFGLATPRVYWGFRLVNALVEAITGKTLHLHISSLEQLRDGFARRAGGSVVMTSDLPDAELAAFVCGSGLPVIVFADDAKTLLDWTISSRGMSGVDAARFSSRMYSSLAPNLTARRKLVLAADIPAERAIAEIVAFLWPGRGEGLAAQTFAHLVDTNQIGPPAIPTIAVAGGEERDAALAALAGYAPLAQGRESSEIDWPMTLFTRLDDRPWGAPFDLLGPARVVLFGPYMHLPVGDWRARVEFEIVGAVSGVEAITDIRINEVVTEKAFIMPAKGIFAYELNFHVADPHLAVEIRLFIQKSAIEGVFLPRSVRVTPQRPA